MLTTLHRSTVGCTPLLLLLVSLCVPLTCTYASYEIRVTYGSNTCVGGLFYTTSSTSAKDIDCNSLGFTHVAVHCDSYTSSSRWSIYDCSSSSNVYAQGTGRSCVHQSKLNYYVSVDCASASMPASVLVYNYTTGCSSSSAAATGTYISTGCSLFSDSRTAVFCDTWGAASSAWTIVSCDDESVIAQGTSTQCVQAQGARPFGYSVDCSKTQGSTGDLNNFLKSLATWVIVVIVLCVLFGIVLPVLLCILCCCGVITCCVHASKKQQPVVYSYYASPQATTTSTTQYAGVRAAPVSLA